MNKFLFLSLLFFGLAILNFGVGIFSTVKSGAPAWPFLFAGFCFLIAGGVWLIKAKSKSE